MFPTKMNPKISTYLLKLTGDSIIATKSVEIRNWCSPSSFLIYLSNTGEGFLFLWYHYLGELESGIEFRVTFPIKWFKVTGKIN